MTDREIAIQRVVVVRANARFYISLPMAINLRKLHEARLVEEMANN